MRNSNQSSEDSEDMSSLASDASPDTQSTGDTSSCDLDSETDTPSSPTSSFGIASPRQDPPAAAPRASPVPKLGLSIPRLDLGSGGAAPSAQPAQRGVGAAPMIKPGPLNLANLQQDTSSPINAQNTSSGRGTSTQLAVELLSPAFTLASGPVSRDIHDLQVECAGKFGVRQDRVELYALMPISSAHSIPSGCEKVAVHVHGSDFSLQAIEEVLTENQKLKSIAPSVATASLATGNANNSELELLKQEVAHLRQRLMSSEMLRHRGQQALQELKEEFETLHFDLLQHTDNVLSARTPRPTLELTAGHD